MVEEQILQLAENYFDYQGGWIAYSKENILNFARAIIEEHEKVREHNLSNDAYFNSWRE